MKCVHGVRIDKPCPDCAYEEECRQRGVKPENRWDDHPQNPKNIRCRCNATTLDQCNKDCLMEGFG